MALQKPAHWVAALFTAIGLASPVAAATYLTQSQLLSLLPGHSVSGLDNGNVKFVTNYKTGGTMGKATGVYGSKPFEASWYVQGNRWCENWGTGSACYKVQKINANTLQMYYQGKPLKHTWALK